VKEIYTQYYYFSLSDSERESLLLKVSFCNQIQHVMRCSENIYKLSLIGFFIILNLIFVLGEGQRGIKGVNDLAPKLLFILIPSGSSFMRQDRYFAVSL